MASSRRSHRVPRLVFIATSNAALLWAEMAFAAENPSGGPATASDVTRLVVAIWSAEPGR